jgi:hypothetical protein
MLRGFCVTTAMSPSRPLPDNYSASAGGPQWGGDWSTQFLEDSLCVVTHDPFCHAARLFLTLTLLTLNFHNDGKYGFAGVAHIL